MLFCFLCSDPKVFVLFIEVPGLYGSSLVLTSDPDDLRDRFRPPPQVLKPMFIVSDLHVVHPVPRSRSKWRTSVPDPTLKIGQNPSLILFYNGQKTVPDTKISFNTRIPIVSVETQVDERVTGLYTIRVIWILCRRGSSVVFWRRSENLSPRDHLRLRFDDLSLPTCVSPSPFLHLFVGFSFPRTSFETI